jgi:hypothetical protein
VEVAFPGFVARVSVPGVETHLADHGEDDGDWEGGVRDEGDVENGGVVNDRMNSLDIVSCYYD